MVDTNPVLSVIHIWASMAWADGVLDPKESETLRSLIDSVRLDEQDRAAVLSWLEAPVEIDSPNLMRLDETTRWGIYRTASKIASVDLRVTVEEREFLARLRGVLGISEAKAVELEASPP